MSQFQFFPRGTLSYFFACTCQRCHSRPLHRCCSNTDHRRCSSPDGWHGWPAWLFPPASPQPPSPSCIPKPRCLHLLQHWLVLWRSWPATRWGKNHNAHCRCVSCVEVGIWTGVRGLDWLLSVWPFTRRKHLGVSCFELGVCTGVTKPNQLCSESWRIPAQLFVHIELYNKASGEYGGDWQPPIGW